MIKNADEQHNCLIGALFVKKPAWGGFFDEFCTLRLLAFGSPGGEGR